MWHIKLLSIEVTAQFELEMWIIKDTKRDSTTANLSTFFSDKQITYVKWEMNKQYTVGIMKLAGPTKKKLTIKFLT